MKDEDFSNDNMIDKNSPDNIEPITEAPKKERSRTVAFFLGFIPVTGVLGFQSFYAHSSTRIFYCISDLILAAIAVFCLSSAASPGVALFSVIGIGLAIFAYIIALIEGFSYLLQKTPTIEIGKKEHRSISSNIFTGILLVLLLIALIFTLPIILPYLY